MGSGPGLTTPLGFVTAGLFAILLDAVTDKDPQVQEQVCGALCALGESQPVEALRACEEHLRLHEKVLLLLRGGACGMGRGLRGPGCRMGPEGRGLWGGVCARDLPAGRLGPECRAVLLWVENHTCKSDPLCLVACGLILSWRAGVVSTAASSRSLAGPVPPSPFADPLEPGQPSSPTREGSSRPPR